MRMKIIVTLVILAVFAVGCTNENSDGKRETTQENSNTHPINYEPKKEQQDRLEDRVNPPSKQKHQQNQKRYHADQSGNDNMDIFTTKESAEIADHLTKRNDVIQAQVATTEDRVIVGVMLNKHDKQQTDKDQKKIAEIEKSVQKLEPHKEIIVYTDDAHWNQLKDLNSSLKQSNAGENVEKYIEKFLNVDVKD